MLCVSSMDIEKCHKYCIEIDKMGISKRTHTELTELSMVAGNNDGFSSSASKNTKPVFRQFNKINAVMASFSISFSVYSKI